MGAGASFEGRGDAPEFHLSNCFITVTVYY